MLKALTATTIVVVTALVTALLVGGHAKPIASAPAAITATVCTDWLPVRSDCSDVCPSACAAVYNDTGAYTSPSYAYRHQVEVIIHNPNGIGTTCLSSSTSIGLAYIKQNGAWKWSWTSPKGWCGGAIAADSGSAQVKIALFFNGNGAPVGSEYALVTADSEWS